MIYGRLAQLGERLPYKQNVSSSILLSPTIMKSSTCSAPWDFLLPFSSHLIYHLTSCIRAHDHLRVALLLQMMFAAELVRSCYRPPKRRPHVICSMRSFFLPFSFFLCGHLTSCIRDSRSFARRFAPSNDVRCGTSSILLSPTIMKASRDPLRGAFFLPFSFFLYSHITSCIRDSLHFVPRFAPSKCVRCGTSSILLSPTIMKRLHVLRAMGFFIAIFTEK